MQDLNLLKDRAWIEINAKNLIHNVTEIKKVIPRHTNIMAIVKANAYGHGIVEVSKILASIGICDFAVATLEEGILLRKNGIQGNILILGYTNFTDLQYVIEYDLIQTIIDYEYAKKVSLLNLSSKLKVHVKINTGMNRIGERYDHFDHIEAIFTNPSLDILGTYSHLCVADSDKANDIDFTWLQISHFDTCIQKIKEMGYHPGKIHLQSSYGIVNYPNLNYDYVRPGILMYGVHSSKNIKPKIELDLKPVLSLKARITSIRTIERGETVSYGRIFKADMPRKIASISIGYADGYPRNLFSKGALVLIDRKYVPIVGRICMDQLMIDITNISKVEVGDVVTLIDDDKISALEISDKIETITNELLCGLGSRLNRIIIN